MNKILKFNVSEVISMPHNHKILSVQVQNGFIILWALCDIRSDNMNIKFRVYGTGWDLPDDMSKHDYVSTVQDGALVWHIFKLND
ncbi:hypothetical protein VF04_36770 [Nostoc linckia z7]|uniref:DUF7352 domain-containing protein n=1 Tax=Nostoc linckia z7 TaxID=1628745 RepID=A0ABX4KEL7_NOSLI|nr:hypothetical protein VF05_32405 [Nostoc linckia z3]PHJ63621.1 hypothetical protein VF03_29915 [Nostoc linckia z2]PHJ70425.1 hypothetical protein VF06_37610 [Nostoc linckia z4]PHJ83485.1 hypothetical protein VF04_36770 [Nostoc linckia z7]